MCTNDDDDDRFEALLTYKISACIFNKRKETEREREEILLLLLFLLKQCAQAC